MALVVQSERFISQKTYTDEALGPGKYEPKPLFNLKKNFNPFNSTSQRRQKKNRVKPQVTPGPGAYDIVKDPIREKVLISATGDGALKIIEIPKQSTMFKSRQDRFFSKDQDIPGPGTYNYKKQEPQKQRRSKTINIAQEIKINNNYQYVPSVPDKERIFGYTQQQNNQLKLNKPTYIQHTGLPGDSIGPAQYTQTDNFQLNKIKSINYKTERGPGWSKYKEKKQGVVKKQPTNYDVGPGKYDIQLDIGKQYQEHMNHMFMSKTTRAFDTQKGKIANKIIIEKVKQQARNLINDDEFFDEKQFEFADVFLQIQEQVPGPGQYHNEHITSGFKFQDKPERQQFFGSSAIRFIDKIPKTIGPGDYDPNNNKQVHIFIRKSVMPRLPQGLILQKKEILSWISVKMEDQESIIPKIRLIDKARSGVQGNFGVKAEREGVHLIQDPYPGPGYYVNPDIIAYQNYQEVIAGRQSHFFRSDIQRDVWVINQMRAPSCVTYDYKNFSISKQQNLAPYQKKIPFMSKQRRFEYKKTNYQPEQDFISPAFSQQMTQSSKSFHQSDNSKKVPFNSKDSRFNYKQQQKNLNKIGPGQYDPSKKTQWSKKTYNILYSEI